MDNLRTFLTVMSMILTILGVLIKGINDFFINVIKMKYENVPGKQSSFSFVIQIMIYIVGIVTFIIWLLGALNIIITKSSTNGYYSIIVIIIGIIIAFLIFAPIFNTTVVFFDVMNEYIDKLEGGSFNRHKENYKKTIVKWKRLSLVVPIISLIILCTQQYLSKDSSLYILNKENSTIFAGYNFFLVVCFLFLIRLESIYNSIISNNLYIINTKEEKIKCRLYLEYSEFYLIFENGHERYIKKSEVVEVRKVLNSK
ncbi:hypothetical protein [Clostridium paraputrificum]|uniref:hypothetical protein n=1 Tax=Clostridium paraputrificum TaxID=29363 RepID=UPI0003FDE272|nr:hypothetical protein [Clostridium paraputrificum]